MKRAVTFISLAVFLSYFIFNHHGTPFTADPFQKSVTLMAGEATNEWVPFSGEDTNSIAAFLFKHQLFLFIVVLVTMPFTFTPIWYFHRILQVLTPVFYGADFLINPPRS